MFWQIINELPFSVGNKKGREETLPFSAEMMMPRGLGALPPAQAEKAQKSAAEQEHAGWHGNIADE